MVTYDPRFSTAFSCSYHGVVHAARADLALLFRSEPAATVARQAVGARRQRSGGIIVIGFVDVGIGTVDGFFGKRTRDGGEGEGDEEGVFIAERTAFPLVFVFIFVLFFAAFGGCDFELDEAVGADLSGG